MRRRNKSILEATAVFVSLILGGRACFGNVGQNSLAADPSADEAAQAVTLPDGLTKSSLTSFDSCFDSISRSQHLAIVVEGVPLRQQLTAAQLDALLKLISAEPGGDFRDRVAIIARAFDFDAKQVNDRTLLLRKRYSDPNDLPCVTHAEVVRSLAALLAVVDSYAPSPLIEGNDTSAYDFYGALTADQKARASDGIDLKLADLDPAQRSLALATARQVVLESKTGALRAILKLLRILDDDRTVFEWTKYSDAAVFAFAAPVGFRAASIPYALSGGFMVQHGGSATRPDDRLLARIAAPPDKSPLLLNRTTPGVGPGSPAYDPTDPTPLDRLLAPGMLSGRLASTVTLAEFAQRVSAKKPDTLSVSIDAAVADKPICLYGSENIEGNQLARDVARLCGLEVFTANDRELLLALPKAHEIRQPTDAAAEMVRLIPSSLLRCLQAQTSRIATLFPSAQQTSSSSPGLSEVIEKVSAERSLRAAAIPASLTTYFPADRRLLVLALPAVPDRTSPAVPVNTLGPEPKRLISLMMLSGEGIRRLNNLLQFTPPRCLADPDRMVIHIRMVTPHGRQSLQVSFSYLDDSGQLHNEATSFFGRMAPK